MPLTHSLTPRSPPRLFRAPRAPPTERSRTLNSGTRQKERASSVAIQRTLAWCSAADWRPGSPHHGPLRPVGSSVLRPLGQHSLTLTRIRASNHTLPTRLRLRPNLALSSRPLSRTRSRGLMASRGDHRGHAVGSCQNGGNTVAADPLFRFRMLRDSMTCACPSNTAQVRRALVCSVRVHLVLLSLSHAATTTALTVTAGLAQSRQSTGDTRDTRDTHMLSQAGICGWVRWRGGRRPRKEGNRDLPSRHHQPKKG